MEPGSVDLIVWSEGGSVYPLNMPRKARRYRGASCEDVENPADRLKELATRLQAEIIVGASALEIGVGPDGKRTRTAFNSVYHFTTDGKMSRYDKLVPLPFGEYIPLAEYLPWLRELVQGPGNFQAGTEALVFKGNKANYGTPICYEAILPHVCRRFEGADMLINGSLDTWFGDTAAPHQHAMLATARATELGIPLFRNAYTGVSLVTEPHGRTYAAT
ncbi:MAG: apolipoprotein N-acyltransferase, partial [Myxococcota bacterium]